MSSTQWSLTPTQRRETVSRLSETLFSLAYSSGRSLSDKQASVAAAELEEKAYTVAKVESEVTSGKRPHEESLKAYLRKLAALVVQWGSTKDGVQSATVTATGELDLTGEREFLTREAAQRALAPLFAPDTSIKRVKLSTKSFGLKPGNSAEVAAHAFQAAASSLTDIDLSDVIAGRPETEALAALKIMSAALGNLQIRRLDLSDNALGEKGIRACASAFQAQKGLEFLALQNVGCSIHACNALHELLAHPAQLRCLHFYNNMSDDEGASLIAKILSKAPKMEEFKMASSRVGCEGGIALAKGLQAGSSLTKLDLSDNPMTSEAALALADLIKSQPRLRSLNLNDTSLGDDGTHAICKGLEAFAPNLEELELALNEITADGAKVLADMVAKKNDLRHLNLRENELGDQGCVLLAAGLKSMTKLEHIDLTQNQIGRQGAHAIAMAVSMTPSLKLLALDENEISNAGITALKEIMHSNGASPALGPLDGNDNEARENDEDASEADDEEELAAAFAKTKLV